MLSNLINPVGLGQSAGYQAGHWGWVLMGLMITTGLLALIALTRAGIRHFWATHERGTPELRISEGLPIAALMALCIVLTVKADHVMQYTQNAANTLHSPDVYIQAVMETRPIPNPALAVPSTTPQGAQP